MVFARGPVGHKRTAGDAEITFSRPRFRCYACHDSGIVVNGDGFVNDELPDYDRLPGGRRSSGSDLALICTCPASYPTIENGKMLRGGYRESDGSVRLVDGSRAVGSELSAAAVQRIHQRRLDSWAATERAMNEARRGRALGDASATPWFIAEVRDHLRRTAIEARLAAPSNGGLQSIGFCLAETLGAPGSPLQLEPTTAALSEDPTPAEPPMQPLPPQATADPPAEDQAAPVDRTAAPAAA